MKMKGIFIILSAIIFLMRCTNDYKVAEPYKSEKLATIKAINSVDETELIQKVKIEKFELSKVVLTSEMISSLDSIRANMIESYKRQIKAYKGYRDDSYKDARETNDHDLKNSYLKSAKDYDSTMQKYEVDMKSFESSLENNPLNEYYKNVTNMHLEYGDTTAKIFEVIYYINNARTETNFSFLAKDDTIAYNQEITKEFLASEILKNWELLFNKVYNK